MQRKGVSVNEQGLQLIEGCLLNYCFAVKLAGGRSFAYANDKPGRSEFCISYCILEVGEKLKVLRVPAPPWSARRGRQLEVVRKS